MFQTKTDFSLFHKNNDVVTLTISPVEAKAILDASEATGFVNRRVKRRKVDYYAQLMRDGKWILSNDAICVTSSGKLINGQHRLLAVIQADMSVPFLYMENADENLFRVADTGALRNISDIVYIEGYHQNSRYIGAGALWLYNIVKESDLRTVANTIRRSKTDVDIILKIARIYEKEFNEAIRWYRNQVPAVLSSSSCLPLHILFHLADYYKAEEFFDLLHKQTFPSEKHPVRLFYNSAVKFLATKTEFYTKTTALLMYGVLAWNAFAQNKSLTRLKAGESLVLPNVLGFDKQKFISSIEG